ncbi:MAG: hypothetical protein RSA41_05705, partial [Christensenella sp.]
MKSLFFDSQVGYNAETGLPTYDRPASAADLREMTKKILNNGVYPNPSTNFQVFAHTAEMTVTVKPGVAWIEGAFCAEAEDRMLALQASETLDRIDRIVLRLDLSTNARKIDLYVIKGTAAASPIAPAITRNNTVYELCIANIFVAKNTTVVTGERITDTRMDSMVCGWVTGVIDQVDTTTIYNQYRDWLKITQTTWDEWWKGQQGGIEGYMLQSRYDTTNNGVVDNAELLGGKTEGQLSVDNAAKLGNQPPAYYAKKTEVDAAQTQADKGVSNAATAQGAANAAQTTANAAVCA